MALLLALTGTAAHASQPSVQFEPHANIAQAVQRYLDQRYGQGSDTRFRLGEIDPRLRLHRCDESLTVHGDGNGVPRGGRLTVQVSCSGSSPWRIYVPARIEQMVRVVSLKRPLAAGSRIRANDLGWTEVDANRQSRAYLTDPSRIVGHVLERPAQSGHILSTQDLGIAQIIKRGDHVAMRAGSGGFSVTMEGIAMSSAGVGQRLDVKNSRTGTVVQGTVVDSNTVQVFN